MAYKIVCVCEGRSGDVEFLPEYAIGDPGFNSFNSIVDADHVRASMQAHVDKLKAQRVAQSPGVGGSAGPAFQYMVLPVIDQALVQQLHGHAPPPPVSPTGPVLNFGGAPPSLPATTPR